MECLESIRANIDAAALLQPFVQTAQYANVKVKGALVGQVSALVLQAGPRNQKAVVKHVLPFAISLLSEKKGGLVSACGELFAAIREVVGDLKPHTAQLTAEQRRALDQAMQ